MKKTSLWIGRWMLLIASVVVLIACNGQAPPPPVAPTSTPLPPPPTEVPTSTPPPAPSDTPQPTPTAVATSTPPPAPADTSQLAPAEEAPATSVSVLAAEKPSADLAEAANQIYTQKSCSACHGADYKGGLGSILAGLPAEYIQAVTRNGNPEAGMPAFDQNAISDEDLSVLAQFLSSMTLQGIGVELSPAVVDHLRQAWDALQAHDKAAVEMHLKKAQEAGADAPPGVQSTLKGLVGGLEDADRMEALEAHLRVLVGR